MYLATLTAGNCEFLAVGNSLADAVENLKRVWQKRLDDGLTAYGWEFVHEDVFVRFVRSGDVLVDGTLIHSYDTAANYNN